MVIKRKLQNRKKIELYLIFLMNLCWQTDMKTISHSLYNVGVHITDPVTILQDHILPPHIGWVGLIGTK